MFETHGRQAFANVGFPKGLPAAVVWGGGVGGGGFCLPYEIVDNDLITLSELVQLERRY